MYPRDDPGGYNGWANYTCELVYGATGEVRCAEGTFPCVVDIRPGIRGEHGVRLALEHGEIPNATFMYYVVVFQTDDGWREIRTNEPPTIEDAETWDATEEPIMP